MPSASLDDVEPALERPDADESVRQYDSRDPPRVRFASIERGTFPIRRCVMMGEMATRQDLVVAARAGDDDAFMDLVHLETPNAFRLTLAITREPHDAEDALQEAFVRAWRELPRLRDTERWPAWFRRIVVSSAIDTGRRRKAGRIVPLGFHEPPPAGDCAARVVERDALDHALSHLDARERALIALRFGHDLELHDVAAALGIPLGTVKSRLHRALGRLREELESVDGYRGFASGEAGPCVRATPSEPGV